MVTIRRFITESGRDEVGDWFEALAPKDQARFITDRLELLAASPFGQGHWHEPHYKELSEYGLGEIRTPKYGGVQYRLLGFKGPASSDFTVVAVHSKKAWKLHKSAFDAAVNRKKLILGQPELAHEWNV